MRYPSDQKERTRRLVVETAARVLRRDGIAATAILPLMREAGLTQGAFYKTFASRDELLVDAIAFAAAQTRGFARLWIAEAGAEGMPPLARIIASYLGERHLDARDAGCVIAALGPELWRQPDRVRRAGAALIDEMLASVAVDLPAADRWLVRPLYLMMAGVLANARLATTRDDALAILADGRRAAMRLAGLDAPG